MDFRKNDHGATPHDISINFTTRQRTFIPISTLFCFCKYSHGTKLLWVSKTKRFSTWELLPVYNCHLISFQHIDGADLLTANKKSIRSLKQQTLGLLTGRRCLFGIFIFYHYNFLILRSHKLPTSWALIGSLWSLSWRQTQALHTYRINLSPFTKDFRVWGAPIET